MHTDSRLDEETAFSKDAIEITKMPYFQADEPLITYTRMKSEEIGTIIPIHCARI